MDQRHFAIVTHWLHENRVWLAELDQAIRRSRGPRGLPVGTLLAGFLCCLLDHQPTTVKAVHATLTYRCNRRQRAALGLTTAPVPSVHAFYRTLGRLSDAVRRGFLEGPEAEPGALSSLLQPEDEAGRLGALLDLIVRSTVPPPGAERLWSADTTYLDANCRPISRARFDAGERASDPDASGRRIKRPNGTEKEFFGYAVTTMVRSEGTKEFIDALRVDTASAHDRPKVVEMVASLKLTGFPINKLAIDRGIKSQELNGELRALGVEPVFDLDANEGGYEGTFRGLVIVDGWLYSPALPERLRVAMPKPVPGGPDGETRLRRWREDMAEREHYAWRVRQRLGSGKVQLMAPLRVGCRQPDLRRTMRNRDLSLATCPGDHGKHEACCLTSLVWEASRAPITWQNPPRGSSKWQQEYAKRSSVERGYSMLKNPDLIQLKNKAIRLRGRKKFAIVVALACAAVNLRLASLPVKGADPPMARAA